MLISREQAFAASACGDVPGYNLESFSYDVTLEKDVCYYKPILTDPTDNTVALTPSLSLTIDDSSNGNITDRVIAGYDEPNYSTHTVSVTASNVASYNLTLSDVGINGPAILTGANNTKGSALSPNMWGYGWDDTNVSNDNIAYYSTSSKTLAGDTLNDSSIDFSRKLVFATRFGEDSTSGTYKVTATLSAVATAAEVVKSFVQWNDLVYMQDMSTDTCTYAPVGVEKTLIDIRDDSTYTVKKLSDGKCWMTQNLRITGDSMKSGLGKVITKYDSDVSGNFIVPDSSTSGFSDNASSNAYYGNNTTYGAYYSWCAATAGTCARATNVNDAAIGSICPKGWRLPVGGPGIGVNEFAVVAGLTNTNVTTGTNYWSDLSDLSFANNALTVNGVVWSAAGRYVDSSSGGVGSNGYYWSSTAYSSSNHAYSFYFNYINNFIPASTHERHRGSSVRCVAE